MRFARVETRTDLMMLTKVRDAQKGSKVRFCRLRAGFHPWVVTAGTRGRSGCVAVLLWAWRGHEVVVQQAAERWRTSNFPGRSGAVGINVSEWDAVPDALVRTMLVVMAFDSFQNVLQMRLAEQDEVVEGFAALADEPFGEGVALRRCRRRLDDPDAFGLEHIVERQERRIAIMDQEADHAGRFVRGHAEVSGPLAHPLRVWVRRAACDSDVARLQVDEKQYVDGYESSMRPNLFREEVRGPCDIQVRLDEIFPRHAFSVRGRGQTVALEHIAHVRRRRHVPQFCKLARNAHVAPGVVLGQLDHQYLRRTRFRRSSGSAAPAGVIPFLLLHAAVPRQECFRFDDGDDVGQPVLDSHAVLDQQPTLPFGETGTLVGDEFPQYPVLCPQEIVFGRQITVE